MIEIEPLSTIDADIAVPGSKSLTQRALIAAALADGKSRLIGPLDSEDTRYTSAALQQMGIAILKEEDSWLVHGQGGTIGESQEEIFLGNNGTATRFLTSVVALGRSTFTINGDERMHERPIGPLIEALQGWGVDIRSIHGSGCPPLEVKSRGIEAARPSCPRENRASMSPHYCLWLPMPGTLPP